MQRLEGGRGARVVAERQAVLVAVELQVGDPQQRAAAAAMGGICGHARRYRRLWPQRLDEPCRDLTGGRLVRSRQKQRELVAAEAAERVRRTQQLATALDDPAQQVVTSRVAVSVVDLLEPIEVEQHEPERLAIASRARDLTGQAFVESAPIEA